MTTSQPTPDDLMREGYADNERDAENLRLAEESTAIAHETLPEWDDEEEAMSRAKRSTPDHFRAQHPKSCSCQRCVNARQAERKAAVSLVLTEWEAIRDITLPYSEGGPVLNANAGLVHALELLRRMA